MIKFSGVSHDILKLNSTASQIDTVLFVNCKLLSDTCGSGEYHSSSSVAGSQSFTSVLVE